VKHRFETFPPKSFRAFSRLPNLPTRPMMPSLPYMPLFVAFFGSDSPFEQPGTDMSKIFAKLTSCHECIGAGYGWCPMQRRCGGFANKECAVGANYFSAGVGPEKMRKESPAPKPPKPPKPSKPPTAAGGDMRAEFARYRTCEACTTAGYGWCPNLRRCGGFANKECGIGPNYVSSAPEERNGLWRPQSERSNRGSDAEMVADVPSAAPSPPASLLYAGPIRTVVTPTASSVPADENSDAQSFAKAHLTNETRLERSELERLPVAALVDKILELHSKNLGLRAL